MSTLCPALSVLGRPQPAWGLLGACWGPSATIAPKTFAATFENARPARTTAHTFNSTSRSGGSCSSLHPPDSLRQLQALAHSTVAPALGMKWSKAVVALSERSKAEEAMPSSSMSECLSRAWLGVKNFKVSSIRRVADDCAELTFVPVSDSAKPFDFIPGQYLELHLEGDVPRRYVVTSAPGKTLLQCCVKGVSSSPEASILQGVRPGSTVGLAAPSGIGHSSKRPVVLISAGIGAAYTKAILESAAATSVRLVLHVDRSKTSHAFRKEFRRSCVNTSFHYTSEHGRPSTDVLVKELRSRLAACDFIISGPDNFVESMQFALKAAGAQNVHANRLSYPQALVPSSDSRTSSETLCHSRVQPRQ